MNPAPSVRGLWCALLTPLDGRGDVDPARLVRHAQDCWRPASTASRRSARPARASRSPWPSASPAPTRCWPRGFRAALVAATGCAALPDTVTLTRHGVQSGCAACLVLPPFFWKDASDDGLYTSYARLIDAVGDARLRLYLYHIPQVSGVPLSVGLIARLAAAFPGIVAGVKDSAGDWNNTSALLARVPQLAIMVGHEPHLPKLMRAGGAGTICGVANVHPALVRALLSPDVTPADEGAHGDVPRHRVPAAVAAGLQGNCRRTYRGSGMDGGAPSPGSAGRGRARSIARGADVLPGCPRPGYDGAVTAASTHTIGNRTHLVR